MSRYSDVQQSECIDSRTCRIDNPTSLLQRLLVLQTVGPTQQYNYRYGGQEQSAVSPRTIDTLVNTIGVSPIFCRTIDILVQTSKSLVLLFVGLSAHQSRAKKSILLPGRKQNDLLGVRCAIWYQTFKNGVLMVDQKRRSNQLECIRAARSENLLSQSVCVAIKLLFDV